MNLFYSVILLWIILQLAQAKSLTENSNTEKLSPKKQLVRFYRREFNSLAAEICTHLKDISDGILKDNMVAKPITLFVHEFKKNVTNFNIIYPFYVRYGMHEALARIFAELVSGYVNQNNRHKDFVQIQKLLVNLGYHEIRDKYTVEFEQFFAKKFVPKFEHLRKQITNKSLLEKFEKKFLKCAVDSKRCQDYECYLNIFHISVLKLSDQLKGIIQRHFFNIILIHMHKSLLFYKAIIKDRRAAQLSPPIRQQLEKLSEYKFEHFTSFEFVFRVGNLDLLPSFQGDATFELLVEIFNDHGYENNSFEKYLYASFDSLGKEIKNFRSAHTEDELVEEPAVWEMLKYVNSTSNPKEIAAAMISSGALNHDEIKKWKI